MDRAASVASLVPAGAEKYSCFVHAGAVAWEGRALVLPGRSRSHTGEIGKYSHGDAVRQARWAESLATEALFLTTGETR